jgi:hypothetical protein
MYSVRWLTPEVRYYIGEDKSYMEAMNHPFRPPQGLAAPDLLLDTMLRLTHGRIPSLQYMWYMRPPGNMSGLSQSCCPKSKTYKDVLQRFGMDVAS